MRAKRSVSELHGSPQGDFDRQAAWRLVHGNREASDWVVSLLAVQPTDRVLDVGFGPGLAIHRLASLVTREGRVAGIDSSDTMVRRASLRNAAAIAAGRVELRCGVACLLPYADETFDKALAVNLLHFLPEPLTALLEMRRVLRPGGRAAICLLDPQIIVGSGLAGTHICTAFTEDEVADLLRRAGFGNIRLDRREFDSGASFCALAEK